MSSWVTYKQLSVLPFCSISIFFGADGDLSRRRAHDIHHGRETVSFLSFLRLSEKVYRMPGRPAGWRNHAGGLMQCRYGSRLCIRNVYYSNEIAFAF